MSLAEIIQFLSSHSGLSPEWSAVAVGVALGLLLGKISRRNKCSSVVHVGTASTGSAAPDTPATALNPEVTEQALALVRANKFIEAIKLIRQHTGLDLADAKKLAESLRAPKT